MKPVTFLLFLASLAVMEYLLSKPHKKPDDNPKGVNRGGATAQYPMSPTTTMPGLLALGQALETQGRGKTPGVEQVPPVHAPPVDGV
ncbi:MAG: hypothetical protein ACLQKA_18005 [Bryobacteraceae bacterium]